MAKLQATIKMNDGKYKEASQLFESWLKENATDLDSFKWLGVCQRMLARFEDALKCFDMACGGMNDCCFSF
jgi:hypothetical protein